MSVKRSILLIIISMALGVFSPKASDFDYSKGIFIINEDWYGHQNSSINFLDPDNPDSEYWHYRIVREENPGMELGCTNQYAALWNGKLYCIAKQEKDPGANILGGRITVCDASTLKILHQQLLIDPSGAQCDGRAFVGIDNHKGYISSSNGIWIYDLDNYEIKGMIEGSGNPYAGGDNDKPNTDPTGALYYGQTGIMIFSDGLVFAAHQQFGLLIIDAQTDSIIDIISMDMVEKGAGIGSLIQSKDGNLWISVAKNTQGLGTALNYLVKLNPKTLEYEIKELPDGIFGPLNSWYAWTPDAFAASTVQNCIYWKGGANRWFTGIWIYKYDIDKDECSLFINLENDPDDWKLYGCSLGVHPVTDEIYMSLFHHFGKPEYMVRRYSPKGEIIKDYPMIENYWFPSIMIFTDLDYKDIVSNNKFDEIEISVSGTKIIIKNGEGEFFKIFSIDGKKVCEFKSEDSIFYHDLNLSPGIYIITGKSIKKKFLIH